MPWKEVSELQREAQENPELRAAALLLHEHYGEPVLPVRAYCSAFELWVEQLIVKYRDPSANNPPAWMRELQSIRLWIRKSNLLARLLYDGETLRTRQCPEHKGEWSGVPFPGEECAHGCGHTGWLPNEALGTTT